MKPTTKNFNDLPVAVCRRTLLHRFLWLRRHRRTVDFALALQCAIQPMPDGYFRWHLPRVIATLTDLVLPACRCIANPRILVVGSWPGFTHLLREWLAWQNVAVKCLVPTSISGEAETFTYRGRRMCFETEALTIGSTPFPWQDKRFDIVLVCEIIEHLLEHPQYGLVEINRILDDNGQIIVTTPNAIGWKKLYAGSRGDWGYDSSTFSGEWGHRYEYSSYQMHNLLTAGGFVPINRTTRDVYFDDPRGLRQSIQKESLILAKILTGDFRSAVKLAWRGGSTLLLRYAKQQDVTHDTVIQVRI